jgi:cytochrome c oxidase cbb3-type subunit 3
MTRQIRDTKNYWFTKNNNYMKKLAAFFFILFTGYLSYAQSAPEGEKIFNANCKACHSIGKGKVVGPDLKNVQERRKEAWLLKFIKSPGQTIKAGDPVASKLFEENNKVLMPDHSFLSDNDIKNVISYITEESKTEATISVEKKAETQPVTKVITAPKEISTPIPVTDYIIYSLFGISIVLVIIAISMVFQINRLSKIK